MEGGGGALWWLYLIEILHQTTTFSALNALWQCCILLKFYIKPQQDFEQIQTLSCCILLKFYIKPQHTWTPTLVAGVVSY